MTSQGCNQGVSEAKFPSRGSTKKEHAPTHLEGCQKLFSRNHGTKDPTFFTGQRMDAVPWSG